MAGRPSFLSEHQVALLTSQRFYLENYLQYFQEHFPKKLHHQLSCLVLAHRCKEDGQVLQMPLNREEIG